MGNVVGLEEARQNRDLKNNDAQDRYDILAAMFEGIERSRFGSLKNLALEVAERSPKDFLRLLSRYCIEPPDKD